MPAKDQLPNSRHLPRVTSPADLCRIWSVPPPRTIVDILARAPGVGGGERKRERVEGGERKKQRENRGGEERERENTGLGLGAFERQLLQPEFTRNRPPLHYTIRGNCTLHQRTYKMAPPKQMYLNVHRSFTRSCPNLETMQMSGGRKTYR